MKGHTFTFRGKTYQLTDKWEETMVNDSKDFQLFQFKSLIKAHDYDTVKRRVINQLKFGYLEEVPYIKE
jgi:hypothetical protein